MATEDVMEELDLEQEGCCENFDVGDLVFYPNHGAGQIVAKESRKLLGEEKREYLKIRIDHSSMTVMVPSDNTGQAGLRKVVDEPMARNVFSVLEEEASDLPGNWVKRIRVNTDKIKSGDICSLAEVVRDLTAREGDHGLSSNEKQMLSSAKRVLASELIYVLKVTDETQAEEMLDEFFASEGQSKPLFVTN